MIQRIQTVYLLIALISMAICLFVPYGSYEYMNESHSFNSVPFVFGNGTAIYAETLCVYLSIALSIFSIFSFKIRKRQQALNKINFLVLIALIVFMLLGFNRMQSSIGLTSSEIGFQFGLFLPIIALVAIIMGYRAIKRDEDLIKSMDRIR